MPQCVGSSHELNGGGKPAALDGLKTNCDRTCPCVPDDDGARLDHTGLYKAHAYSAHGAASDGSDAT